MTTSHQNQHLPVLLAAVLQYLSPQPGETYLDATAGYGGHAKAVLAQTHAPATLIDRDQQATAHLEKLFSSQPVAIKHQDFLHASQELVAEGEQFDLILADLGLSSPHLNTANRGFSLQTSGPLDMRMDQSQLVSAEDIVNGAPEGELVTILRRYGEEPHAASIAKAITMNRPIHTTTELAELITGVVRGRGKVHPATRTFQALRIAVNGELAQLDEAIPLWIRLLKPGGRIAIISFHSLEDRIVKQSLADSSVGYEATLKLLTKKPVIADRQEIAFNPRARSAKLRAAAKIKIKSPMVP
ncbi:MAG TPA: 16S rRNA (cytosine(1402)-N(4))-methyltransferase RsmH [Patescibacteria group bacterium]|nr:16S rRNA (cytosine(1402)-N(4))-methyltransferase RsmH [Patescibacteria group bacterium]